MILMERDKRIMSEIERWRYLLGRQIKELCNFSGQRATDRRLKKLIDEHFTIRKHIIYGLPGLYFVTQKGADYFNLSFPVSNVKIEHIQHDITVVDTAIYFINAYGIKREDIITERELRQELGFNPRIHLPDFTYIKDNKKYCVEVELSVKAKARLETNIKSNYLKYDVQQWVISESKPKIKETLEQVQNRYTNIEILSLEVIQNHAKTQKSK
jgi:hypothetical protein